MAAGKNVKLGISPLAGIYFLNWLTKRKPIFAGDIWSK